MSGTPHTDTDKSKFTEKNVDDLYELGILNTDQMWKLREAVDIWEEAQRRYRKKFSEAGFKEPVSYKDIPKEERPANRRGPQEQSLDPSEIIEQIRQTLTKIEGKYLSGRLYGKLRTVRDHLEQISESLQR